MNSSIVKEIFRWTAALFLLGRSYQHLFFEGPYRAFFMDESLFGGVVKKFTDLSWFDYISFEGLDPNILFYTRIVGILWLITASFFIFFQKIPKWLSGLAVAFSALTLFFLAFCYYCEKGFQWAQWIEYSSQFMFPILAFWVQSGRFTQPFIFLGKIAVALTFLGHGLYALGVFPVPGNFVYMTIVSLGVSNEMASNILFIAGVLDMLVVILLFVPKMDKAALIYAALWGLLTSIARPRTMILLGNLFWLTLHQSFFEFVVRIPHFMLPLLILLAMWKRETPLVAK